MARHEHEGIEYVDSAEACALLDIKPATLYAYVSRGRIASYRRGGGRSRLYRLRDVDDLRAFGPTRAAVVPPVDDWLPYVG
jgi:citrate synthase